MSVDYNTLKKCDREKLSQAVDIKRSIVSLSKNLETINNDIFDIVKTHNGVRVNDSTISYVREGDTTLAFSVDKFKNDHPRLYRKYCEPKKGSKEHLAYTIH